MRDRLRVFVGWCGAALRFIFWPRGGWQRNMRYVFVRLVRMRSTPHEIAIGFAAGVFVSFTPFLGFHFLLAAILAWLVRGNIVASAFGTFAGNPLTFPFMWAGSYMIGFWTLNGEATTWKQVRELLSLEEINIEVIREVFYPLLVGGLPLGFLISVIVYVIVAYLVGIYRKN